LEPGIKTAASPFISPTLVLASAAATWVQKTEEKRTT
jgi:hypothetical protein